MTIIDKLLAAKAAHDQEIASLEFITREYSKLVLGREINPDLRVEKWVVHNNKTGRALAIEVTLAEPDRECNDELSFTRSVTLPEEIIHSDLPEAQKLIAHYHEEMLAAKAALEAELEAKRKDSERLLKRRTIHRLRKEAAAAGYMLVKKERGDGDA